MLEFGAVFEPGVLVTCPEQPSWGIGQVQSVIGTKITVMFPEEGKLVIDGTQVSLVRYFQD